jgi:FKBP-type peptidyl-prolyl cis-trans isomerase FkpA
MVTTFKMKKCLLLLSFVVALFASCGKDEPPFDAAKQAAEDEAKIQDFIKTNNINAIKDPSGLYYEVVKPGTGSFPVATSTVTVNYNGKLLNGNSFDSNTGFEFRLDGVIPGWTIGIPKINSGGRIRLIVPSALAYGNRSPGPGIPANSVLDFTVDLLSFK